MYTTNLQILYLEGDAEAGPVAGEQRDADVPDPVDGGQILHPARLRLELAHERYRSYLNINLLHG